MKVTLEPNYKNLYTLNDLQAAKEVIRIEKEDTITIKEYAEMAAREALKGSNDHLEKIIEASAETCKCTNMDFNGYGDYTGYMGVWIRATAKTFYGYLEVSGYLHDIWQTGAKEYKQNMYIQYYKRTDL